MQAVTIEEDLAAWVDVAARIAGRHPGVEAFETRGDVKRDRAISLLDGKPNITNAATSSGVGVLVFAGGASAYVHAGEPSERRLVELVDRAVRLAQANARRSWRHLPSGLDTARRATHRPRVDDPAEASTDEVIALLRRASDSAREAAPDARIAAAFGSLTRDTRYVDSAGSSVTKRSIVSTLRVGAVLREGTRLGDASVRSAGERGLVHHSAGELPEALGRDAVEQAREALRAVSFPAGRYRVLCDGHLSGMLAHESFGHLAEHDLVDSGWSTLRGRIGERLAVEGVSISDAPVSPGDPSQGVPVPIDDQGVRGRKVTMLERGVLREWMHSRETAALVSAEPTGNGRALDSRFPSIVRMRNTFFEPGDASLEEALQELGDGIYLLGARGGAPYSDGSFMFTSHRGFRVENGRIAEPVRSTSIHGNVLDFLKGVLLLTKEMEIHTNYFGGCGKGDQSFLHVGVGGPHVLVEGALLGGQGA